MKAKISVVSVLVYWLSVPFALFLIFMNVIRPKLQKAVQVADLVERVDTSTDVSNAVNGISHVIAVIGLVCVLILLFVWICFCAFMTPRLVKNYLAITDSRVIGMNRQTEMYVPLAEVKDIFLEQSLFGKIFKYGSITICAVKGSITVSSIHDPKQFRRYFIANQDLFTASGTIV